MPRVCPASLIVSQAIRILGGSGRNTYGDYGQLFGNNRERFQKLRPRNVMCLAAHAALLSLSSLSDCLLLTVTQLAIAKKLSCM